MQGCVDEHVEAGRATRDCAEQVADAARTAALAERQRLARDLHDSVTQTLISLHLSAQAAAELWDTQPTQARAALDTIRHLATGATTEMRAVLVDLHDAVLHQHGLVSALEVYGAVVRQRSGLPVEVRAGGIGSGARAGTDGPDERLPAAHEEALYRLAQEALANVVKHARATRAHHHARPGHDGTPLHRGRWRRLWRARTGVRVWVGRHARASGRWAAGCTWRTGPPAGRVWWPNSRYWMTSTAEAGTAKTEVSGPCGPSRSSCLAGYPTSSVNHALLVLSSS